MNHPRPDDPTRRTLMRSLLTVGAITVATAGCSSARPSAEPGPSDAVSKQPLPPATGGPRAAGQPRVLLAYFSRPGENYSYGGRVDLDVGNTEVLAGLIAEHSACTVYRIEAADSYPDDYDATVERNRQEQDSDARPVIANPLPDLANFDTVVLASPIWGTRLPMIMRTFVESGEFAGKTIHPVTTHAMSGLGSAVRDYSQACPGATVGEGLAVRGEEVASAGPAVSQWLARCGLVATPAPSPTT